MYPETVVRDLLEMVLPSPSSQHCLLIWNGMETERERERAAFHVQ